MSVIKFAALNVISALYFSSLAKGDAGNTWGYQDGIPPALWLREYRTCGGRHQSPIDIQTKQIRLNQRLGRFDLSDLNNVNNIRLTLENNGHTAEVDVEGLNNRLVVRRGGLPGPYTVKQFHFHWGSQDSRGSEHDINGRFFPMEMHVVTYSQRYRMFEEAKNATGGLAVLSFLFDVGAHNPAFDEIIGHLNDVRHKDDHVNIQAFALGSLFPQSTDVFYRYYGGLTTPPCYESVIWTIFQEHIRISERQINQFRLLSDRHFRRFRPLSDNFRPTQPLNGRYVYTNDRRGYQYQRQGTFGRQSQQLVTAPNRPFVNRPQFPVSKTRTNGFPVSKTRFIGFPVSIQTRSIGFPVSKTRTNGRRQNRRRTSQRRRLSLKGRLYGY